MRTRATSASTTSSRSRSPRPHRAGGPSCGAPSASSAVPDSRWSVRAWRSAERCPGARACPPRRRSRWRCAWPCSTSARAIGPGSAAISTDLRSRGCAPVSRTTGSVPAPDCSTSSPRSSVCPNARFASTSARCRSIPCRWPSTAGAWSLLGLGRAPRNASSGYNERRAECARACRSARRRVAARGNCRGGRAAS